MSEENNTTSEPERPAWTEQQQIEAFEKAQAAARKQRPNWSDDDQQEAALRGWERWKTKSRGVGPWQYVKFEIGDMERERQRARGGKSNGKELEVTAMPRGGSNEPQYEHNHEAAGDLAELTKRDHGSTVTLQIEGRGPLVRIDQDLDHETLARELEALAARYRLLAHRERDDTATEIADMLEATADPEFRAKNKGKARHRREQLERANKGARTRNHEADILISTVQRNDAAAVVRWLRVLPKIAADTTLPMGPLTDDERAEVTATVDKVLTDTTGQQPESRAKAVLRALGAPKSKVNNLDAHLRRK